MMFFRESTFWSNLCDELKEDHRKIKEMILQNYRKQGMGYEVLTLDYTLTWRLLTLPEGGSIWLRLTQELNWESVIVCFKMGQTP